MGGGFAARHLGLDAAAIVAARSALGLGGDESIMERALPRSLREAPPQLAAPLTEAEVAERLAELAARNDPGRPMIGLGYYRTSIPSVIRRSILENPSWYTAYTPYQPEISQGRLEALFVFQTMIADLTGLEVANASLLDEATAAAEAMTLAHRAARGKKRRFAVDRDAFPQVKAVLATRAEPLGIELVEFDPPTLVPAPDSAPPASGPPPLPLAAPDAVPPASGPPPLPLAAPDAAPPAALAPRPSAPLLTPNPPAEAPAPAPFEGCAGVYVQYRGASGRIVPLGPVAEAAHAAGALLAVGADPLMLTLAQPPGEAGADICVGSTQRFGVPLGFGGPHAAFMSVRPELVRQLPGRLVGLTVDADGGTALRLALVTREQHIRREKATSNICTAQVLLAVMAAAYGVWHGPDGLRRIAGRIRAQAEALREALDGIVGVTPQGGQLFDTLAVYVPGEAETVVCRARQTGLRLRHHDPDWVYLSTDEPTTPQDLRDVVTAFGGPPSAGDQAVARAAELTQAWAPSPPSPVAAPAQAAPDAAPASPADAAPAAGGHPASPEPDAVFGALTRRSDFMKHPVFHRYHTELALMRYLKSLADRDYAMDRGMIPLGSCTMKLNAATELAALTWGEFGDLHPFQPAADAAGTLELISELTADLLELTGYDALSLQPNAGSQGELAGLLAIRGYHLSRGETDRRVCLIPVSAHGTNAASAALAGFEVVGVGVDPAGNVSLEDLKAKLAAHEARVGALMITYPSTHGVFEEDVRVVCALAHEAGAQVYIDGANFNALVGHARAGHFGGDVSHLNLHKTFAIPHGGGGPGVGPVAVRAHLAAFLPGHPLASGAGAPGPATASPLPATASPLPDAVPPHPAPLPAGGSSAKPPAVEAARAGAKQAWASSAEPPAVEAARAGAVSAAPYGSPLVLPISWAYIKMMGADGLMAATEGAVLAANYVARRLAGIFPLLYSGPGGFVAHECLLDLRDFTARTGVTVDDVAKRLMDLGFHAPTMSFPVAGTLMVEPTESETLAELDRFCEAMELIAGEAERVACGEWLLEDSPLRRAPHTAAAVTADSWERPYSRRQGAYPSGQTTGKYWPPVGRVDAAYGDRHLVAKLPD
ncbi:MAG: glycine dehydrogenase [Bifidobacteriaceae bacterium]|jgi:glycine dehydrogenase|nr:glycine dehydrogenase [Bifidobacteriaceae bacterium]